MKNSYDDIINLPHHTSDNHPRMSMKARAAQFSPFVALTGFEESIKEVEKTYDKRIDLSDDLMDILNSKLLIISNNIDKKCECTFTYFVYEDNKINGKYITVTGIVKKINMVDRYLILTNQIKIPINEIIDITSDLLIL